MLKEKFIASLILALTLMALPINAVLASPSLQDGFIAGTVTELACETDINTGVTMFLVSVEDSSGTTQTVRLGQLTAEELGLVTVDENGNPDCSEEALAESIGMDVEIDPATVILEESQHPVGSALATFFSDIINYDEIMAAHENGVGFGVIAQALWLTQKLQGNANIFTAILEAKESKDFSVFILDDGTTPKNWGQLRKAIMDDGKDNLGIVMSGEDHDNGQGNGNGHGNGNGNSNSNKAKDKENNRNGNSNKDK